MTEMKHDRSPKAPRENGVGDSSCSEEDSPEGVRKNTREELDVLFGRMAQIYRWVKKMDIGAQARALEFMETVIRQRQKRVVQSAADKHLKRKLHSAYGFLDLGAELSDAEYGPFLRVQIENEGRLAEKRETATSSSTASTATAAAVSDEEIIVDPYYHTIAGTAVLAAVSDEEIIVDPYYRSVADTAVLAAVSDEEIIVDPYYRAIVDASEDSDDSYDPLSESPRALLSSSPHDVSNNGSIDDESSGSVVRPPLKAHAIERDDASLIGVEIYAARVIATPQSDGSATNDASAVCDDDIPLDAYTENNDNVDDILGFEGNVSNKSSEGTDSDLDWTILAAPANSEDGEDVEPDARGRTESAAKRRRCNLQRNSEPPPCAESLVAPAASDSSSGRSSAVVQPTRKSSLLRNAVINSKASSPAKATAGLCASDSDGIRIEGAAGVLTVSTADADTIREEETVLLSQKCIFEAEGFI